MVTKEKTKNEKDIELANAIIDLFIEREINPSDAINVLGSSVVAMALSALKDDCQHKRGELAIGVVADISEKFAKVFKEDPLEK